MANTNTEKKYLVVEREPYKKDGKEYNAYVINGEVRGRKVKVNLTPPDIGGYAIYDLIFNGAKTARLDCVSNSMTDEKTGEKKTYVTYELFDVDESGVEYRAKINARQSSDKALLAMLQYELDCQNKK